MTTPDTPADTIAPLATSLNGEVRRELERARHQLAAVRALHRADDYQAGVKGCRACSDCCDTLIPWPCATIRAMDVAAEPCAATCPGLPFVACTYPAGHPPIPKDIRGAGWRDMDHGNDGKHQVWWNGSTAIVSGDAIAVPAAPVPEPNLGTLRRLDRDPGPADDECDNGPHAYHRGPCPAAPAAVAAPVVAEEATAVRHGHTEHGHYCCRLAPDCRAKGPVAKCGGPGLCAKCLDSVARMHAAPVVAEPADVQQDGVAR